MPPKKKTASQVDQGAVAAQGNVFSEGADPMGLAIGVIDKKARNLEKRKVCLSVPSGTALYLHTSLQCITGFSVRGQYS